MDTFSAIFGRCSVRRYLPDAVTDEQMERVLEAARWAPSGLNNQPWRFMLLSGADKDSLAPLTHYGKIILGASAAIAVFLYLPDLYNRDKDMMAAGAAVQNMLLAAHEQGLGACWLGEIVNRGDEVRTTLGLGADYEFCACVTFGRPKVEHQPRRKRKDLSSILLDAPGTVEDD